MLDLKPPTKKRRKELEIHPVRRMKITTDIEAHVDKGFQRKLKNTQKQIEKQKRKHQEPEQGNEDDDDGFEYS